MRENFYQKYLRNEENLDNNKFPLLLRRFKVLWGGSTARCISSSRLEN